MGDWYIKGGSVFDDPDAEVWTYVDRNGYDESLYATRDWNDIEEDDPFWRLGTGAIEVGLYNGWRLRITSDGLTQWNDDDSQWQTIVGDGMQNVIDDTTPQLGGMLDLNDKGFTAEFVAGEDIDAGEICYLKSDGEMWLADANGQATAESLITIALDSPLDGESGEFLLMGYYDTGGAALTVASPYCLSTTPGEMVTLAVAGAYSTPDICRIIGYALTTGILFFCPDKTFLEMK